MRKKINAGDTLTVGDLTDDYLGAVIEVGPVDGFTTRLNLDKIVDSSAISTIRVLCSKERAIRGFYGITPVTVITPPSSPRQPDEPTAFGQCIRIEGDDLWLGVVMGEGVTPSIMDVSGTWWAWEEVTCRAGERQIIVSDPPRWPDETHEVPERIERGDWPADDTHLRDYKWIDRDGGLWRWDDRDNRKSGWNWNPYLLPLISPLFGPWTRGNRVEVKAAPKAGDVFTSIEDMPYGWVAKAVDDEGQGWGYVVREDIPFSFGLQHTHRWSGDLMTAYRNHPVSEWVSFGEESVSGGHCQSYTLVETVDDHDKRLKAEDDPKAGNVFTSIEDMPYGWIAEVTLKDGASWGYVVRHDDGAVNHLWDCEDRYGMMFTRDWKGYVSDTISGGADGVTRYTLVETVSDHDYRVSPSLGF